VIRVSPAYRAPDVYHLLSRPIAAQPVGFTSLLRLCLYL
jgi:hypothetical protein